MNAIARYPSHLISNSQSLSSNGFSMDSASMGWMVVGIGRFTGTETIAAEDSEEAEDLGVSPFRGALDVWGNSCGLPLPFAEVRAAFRPPAEVFALSTSASCASSRLLCFFF